MAPIDFCAEFRGETATRVQRTVTIRLVGHKSGSLPSDPLTKRAEHAATAPGREGAAAVDRARPPQHRTVDHGGGP